MLHELHIEALGVIDRLDLVLGPGLTALTGETGAGKTMLVEAISLLVGGRADSSVVRPGADEARVEGRFVVGDEEYIVARVIPSDGRSRAYVNGRLATVGNLAELGQRCVDLHGQHSHQSLLSASEQRDALDRFCGTDLAPLVDIGLQGRPEQEGEHDENHDRADPPARGGSGAALGEFGGDGGSDRTHAPTRPAPLGAAGRVTAWSCRAHQRGIRPA